jgi:HK97 family phage prohead protease
MKNINNKVFHLNSQFTKELPATSDTIDSIFISGYASAAVPDRDGDIIPSSVWAKGIQNYLKNPIVLAYHDHDDPVGRMVEHKIDSKGLWVKARVSAASEIFSLVKDGVLTAFSIGFRVVDAEYDAESELFVIKELELVEISIVSVPCNQDTLFSLSKSFTDDEDYKLFKLQFVPSSDPAKELETTKVIESKTLKEIGMDPKELQAMLDAAAKNAAELATKSLLDAQAAQAAAKEKALEEEKLMQKRIDEAVARVTPSTTGAEKLLEEVTKRINDQNATLAGLESSLKEKAAELVKIQASKMTFTPGKEAEAITYAEREKAIMLSKITNKGVADTAFGKQLLEKAATYTGGIVTSNTNHLPSGIWELEVSLNMEAEVRRRLVVAPTLRSIDMKTNVMTIPVNPEAGLATWVTNSQFGVAPTAVGLAGASAGATAIHTLKEVTLNAYKLATNEYMAYEEEEDSLIVLLPIIRDAMIRRCARTVDKAFLVGAGSGADPVGGLAFLAGASVAGTSITIATGVGTTGVSYLRAARKNLGAWGLDPKELVFVVSTDIYYALLEDPLFQTMDKVGLSATVLTGQVGMVGGTPVLVSAELPVIPATTGAASTAGVSGLTNVAAICYAPGNFLVGNQRGLRMDTQELVETQRRVLVASLRTGMTKVTSNLGTGAVAIRYTT